MKKIIWTGCVALLCTVTHAQELYVNTEPASNMAKGSMGFRVLSKLYQMKYDMSYSGYRIEPELMLGINRNWMIHFAGYGSNMYQKKFRAEGGSVYAKYRIYSEDEVHKHFRIAAFSAIAVIDNPTQLKIESKMNVPDGNGGFTGQVYTSYYNSDEFDLNGNNSGIAAGLVGTKLVNKFAASASVSYGYRLNNVNNKVGTGQPLHAVNYSTSLGYLLLPRNYVGYDQTNVNVYVEVTGTTFPGNRKYYTDLAPAVQFIFKSIARLDLSYRTQLMARAQRLSNNFFMLRLEYNLLNAF
ncbi:MAG: hypothetical protein ABI416_08185 [Ginsengibacter sp.]